MAGDAHLKCAECGFENETQRIYCHNCGTKLDRSVLPPDSSRSESPEKRVKRVKRIISPKAGPLETVVFPMIRTLLWAACLAAVVLIARPPSSLPPVPSKEESLESRVLGIRMEEHIQSGRVTDLSIDETLANQYLVSSVRTRKWGLLEDEFQLVGASVDFEPNRCLIWARCTLFGWPLYFGAEYDFRSSKGKVEPETVGARIGAIPIHPFLARYAVQPFGPVWEQLKREHRLVLEMQRIRVEKDRIVLTTPPPRVL